MGTYKHMGPLNEECLHCAAHERGRMRHIQPGFRKRHSSAQIALLFKIAFPQNVSLRGSDVKFTLCVGV